MPAYAPKFILTILTVVGCLLLGRGSPLGAATVQQPIDPLAEGETEAIYYTAPTLQVRYLSSATAAVTVIDRHDIEVSGARTIGELLRHAPGVYVSSNGTRGGFSVAQIRGGDPNFTLVLLDGIPLNDTTDQVGGAYNLESLSTADVERIEIIRGPLSHHLGSAALGGVVNILTRRGESENPQQGLVLSAGNASLLRGAGFVSGGNSAENHFLGASWEEEEGRIADDSFEHFDINGNLGVLVGDRADLMFRARFSAWEANDYPEASGGPMFGSGDVRRSDNTEISVAVEFAFGEVDRKRQKLTAAMYRHDLNRVSPGIDSVVPAASEETEFTRARIGWVTTLYSSAQTQVSIGTDVSRETGTNVSSLDFPPEFGGSMAGDYTIDRNTGGVFAELDAVRGDLVVEIGSRLDMSEGHGAEWNPRAGISFRPQSGHTRLHASVGRAFKLPSFFALASPRELGGNPDLSPETTLGGDLGVEQSFLGSRIETRLIWFYNRYKNLVDFDFDTFQHVNRLDVESHGIELSLVWNATPGVTVETDMTFNQVENLGSSEDLLHRPTWFGTARVTWQPDQDITLSLDGQTVSRSLDRQIPVPDRDSVKGYQLVGLSGSWRFKDEWELEGRIDNILGDVYETFIGFPGPGRSIRLGLGYRWR